MDTHLLISGLKNYPTHLTQKGIFQLANEQMETLKDRIFTLQVVSIDASSLDDNAYK
jgi:hypothetical protein